METIKERAKEYVEKTYGTPYTDCELAFIRGAQSERELIGLSLNEYQEKAMTTCLPSCENDMYMLLGLVEEVGELCGKVSKAIRKDNAWVRHNDIERITTSSENKENDEFWEQIKGEAGDILWGLAGLCRQFGWTLEEVAQYNLDKLAKRKESGTIVTHTDH